MINFKNSEEPFELAQKAVSSIQSRTGKLLETTIGLCFKEKNKCISWSDCILNNSYKNFSAYDIILLEQPKLVTKRKTYGLDFGVYIRKENKLDLYEIKNGCQFDHDKRKNLCDLVSETDSFLKKNNFQGETKIVCWNTNEIKGSGKACSKELKKHIIFGTEFCSKYNLDYDFISNATKKYRDFKFIQYIEEKIQWNNYTDYSDFLNHLIEY